MVMQPTVELGIPSDIYEVKYIVAEKSIISKFFGWDTMAQRIHGYPKMNCNKVAQILLPLGSI